MKIAFLFLLSCFVLAGCANKAKNQARVRAAYYAGQRSAMAQMQQQQQQSQTEQPPAVEPQVTVVGAVKTPTLPWTQDLTLAHAIVEAGYESATDPVSIVIHRNGQLIAFDPQRLLNGEDFPLLPGDVVEIQQ